MDPPSTKKSTGKKVAPSPYAVKGKQTTKAAANPLIEKTPKNFGVGQDVQPKRDVSRFVKWPQYVKLQRQKKIIYQRLKVPPALNQFTHVLDKNTATQVFKLMHKYRPESKSEKRERLRAAALAKSEKKEVAKTDKPVVIKYGINHITALVEAKKAQLVVIADDVDPIELVLWLPALCRKMGVPYCISNAKMAKRAAIAAKEIAARHCRIEMSVIGSDYNIMITTTTNTTNNIYLKGQQQEHHPYRPLPSVLTDFFAFKLCDLIPTRPLPAGSKRTAPELVYFILKITSQARISCHIAVVALIYIERCKAALPKNAIGDQGIFTAVDTIHRIFVASLLVASKYLHGTCWGSSQNVVTEEQKSTEDTPVWLNNARMANICSRFYTLQEINQLELSFLNLIKYDCFVNPIEVQEYLVLHRQDLLL
ncbi:ribosomal protein L4 [Mucor ambiguus]|uniref:Ribosomal protein L4 n=1 Tax=Mucor ambiguus TaxID=91626 RepID=A0A0C9M4X9_9FUNG|nr:ribosomal protein L4 [Mucor ambiguus]